MGTRGPIFELGECTVMCTSDTLTLTLKGIPPCLHSMIGLYGTASMTGGP